MAYNKYFGAFTKKPPQKAIMETGARPKGVDTYLDKMAEQRKAEKAQERRVYQAKLTQETRESGAKRVEEAEAKAAGAKKAFDDYMISDERKQRTAEQQKKQEQNRFIQHLLTGTSDIMQPEIIQDDKETQLRKASEDAKQEAAQAKRLAPMADYLARFPVDPEERSQEERTTVEALREFDQMPYADRAALESYAVNGYRDQNLPIELAGIIPTAQQEAAGLIARYGKGKVDAMAAAYMRWQNAQLNEQVAQKSREAVDSGAGGSIGHNIASVAANVGGGIIGTLGQLQNRAMEAGIYGTVDPNAVGSAVNTYVDSVRDETFQNITGDQYNENGEKVEDGGAMRQGAGYLYQAAMSAADSVARMWAAGAFGGGTGLASGLAATQAFSRSMAAASTNGATPAQAALSAAADATWEYLSEKLPLDKLIDMAPQKNFRAILGNALKQAGIEIVGEEANLVASLFSQAFILKEKSDFNLQKQQYMAQGMSEEEATRAATANLWEEAKQTAIVAGMSGGFQGATQTLTGAFGQPDEIQNVQQDGNPAEESPVIEPQEESPLSVQQDPVGQDTESAPVMPEEAAGAPETRELDVVTQAVQQAQQNREAAQNVQQDPTLAQQLTPEQRVQEAVKGVHGKGNTPYDFAEKEAEPTTAGELPKNGSLATPISSASKNNISQSGTEVKGNPVAASDYDAGIKGTGAAEQNFTGKAAYNATLSAGNAQADRRDDVRTMELPKADVDGKNVSAVTGNVYGSKITPDELASLMEEPVARGDFTYAKISNDQATKRAVAAIESAGTWETAFDGWKQDVTKGVAGAEVSARGALLLNRAAETGNKQQWLETLHYMQMLGTNTAQGLQALRIVRTLSIPDKMAFTRMTVNNYIAALAKDGVKIKKGGINALLDQYESASDDTQRDAILSDIQQNIADQVPSTFMEKWNALRYTNMLGNLKTQDRNILGNVGMSVNYKIKDKTAAVIENLVYHLSGKKFERTKSLRIAPKMKRAAMADFKQFADIVSDGGKYGDQLSAKDAFARGVEDKRTIFKSENRVIDAFLKPMEKYRRATNWAMNNEYFGDEAFGRSAYANALAGYLQAHGVKDADLSKVDAGLMDKARAYAIQQAQEATFHDNSAFARTMSKLQKNTGILGQALLPFPKTPANVGTRAVELSPLGFLKTAAKAAQKAASGNEKLASRGGALGAFASKGAEITGADIVDSLAKNLTGTGLFVLGCALRNAGLISGGADEDEKKDNFDKLNGEQNYAFLLPDGGSYTLDWLNPTAVPLFMGANLWDTLSEKSDLTFADLEQVLTAIAEPMLEMSMLQGVSDALDSVKYSDNNIVQLMLNSAVNYLSQGVTNTLMGQLEKTTESVQTTTFVDKDSQIPEWAQKALGKASQKIPGWDFQQVPYINARGEEEKQPGGVGGLLYNTLSPGYYKEGFSDEVTEELNRLYETPEADGSIYPSAPATTVSYTDTSGNTHENYHMTAEEADKLKRTYGQTYNQVLGELVKSKDYQVLSNRLKVNAAQLAQEYATERGKATALADYPQATGWMAGIEGREAEAIVRKVTTSALNDAISAVFTRTKNGWNTKAAESGMEKVYTEYESLSRSAKADILDDVTTETRRYLEARTAGISQERYLSAAKEIATAKPAQGEDTVTQIRRMELLADEPLSPQQKEVLMKLYTSEKQQKAIDKVEEIGDRAGWEDGRYLEIYASAYRLHKDYTSGDGKKNRTIQKYMREYGMDWATASALYKCFS